MAATGRKLPKLQVLPTKDPEGPDQTFVFNGEDHTLGCALKYVILKNPEVQLCAYDLPHPSENKIHFRIQTYGVPAIEVLRQGLNDLHSVCEHVEETFKVALESAQES